MSNIIKIDNLNKSYGSIKAVNNLSFRVKDGELFSFLGINGAGKSTTINMICGELKKDSGTILVCDKEVDSDDKYIKRKIGVVFQESLLDKSLTVYDNLKIKASLYGITGNNFVKRYNELSKLFDLYEIERQTISQLSGGQKRRVDIARAMIHNPEILILDEPTTGLDPGTRKKIWKVLNSLRKNSKLTIFLTTHYMEEAVDSDYIVILDKGSIVAEGTPLELKNKFAYDMILIYNINEDEIKKLKPDVICVVAYGKILPKEILDIPEYGCINVHASLLPNYRGAAPIQWAVINGDEETGVTTMYMDVGMDTGDIILKEKVEIENDETTGELWERLSQIGGKLLVETLKQIENGTAPRIPQSDDFTLAPMLDKEMSKIDWQNKSALEIKNLVRGLNPIMGTYSFLDGKKFKFWKVEILLSQPEYESQDNGTIIKSDSKDGLYIKAKDGIIKVLEIQAENAKKMNIGDFLRGNALEVGKKFE